MRSGILRETAIIQKPIKTRGATGEEITTWQTVLTRRCSLKSLRGGEKQTSGDHVIAIQKWLVTLRWDSEVSAIIPEWRAIVGTRTLDIKAPDNRDSLGNLNRELRIYCEENV